jgi:hypothetical protein
VDAAFATPAGLAVAAETGCGGKAVGAVHPDSACLELTRDLLRLADIFRPDGRGKAIGRVVYNGLANSDSAIMNKLTYIMNALLCEKYLTHIKRQWLHWTR